MSRTQHHLVAVSVGALTLALAGCGSGTDAPSGAPPVDPERMWEVAADPDATAEEIIEAGRPARLSFAGDDAVLVTFVVESEDDEGPQASAWRLYDDEGATVADGRGVRVFEASALPELWDLDDGVLVQPTEGQPTWHVVTSAGEVEEVPVVEGPTATQPDDVALGLPYFFRPGEGDGPGVVHRLPDLRPIGQDVFEIAIDADGGVWATPNADGARLRVPTSTDGREPWTEVPLPVPPQTFPDGVQVSDELVYVPLLAGNMGETLASLAVRDAAAPAAEEWRSVSLEGLEVQEWYGPSLDVMADGRLLLGDTGPSWFIGTEEGDWEQVDLADDGAGALRERDGVLYDLGTGADPVQVSEDGGETWTARAR